MKTIDLKSIFTFAFCILGTLSFSTHAAGQDVHGDGYFSTLHIHSVNSNSVTENLGVNLTLHIGNKKMIFFTNWTAAYHNDPNGAVKVIAECMNVIRMSIQGTKLTVETNQTSVLPASGYNWSDWMQGTQVCEGDIVRLRKVFDVGVENGGEVPSAEPFKLYDRSGNPVKTDPDGHPLINYSCFGSLQFPSIRYMPAEYSGVPEGHTDPNGYYVLYDVCYN